MAMQAGFIKRIRDIMRMDAGINGDAQRIEQMVWILFLKVYDAKEDDWEINEDDYESIIPEECRWRNWAQADINGHSLTGDALLDFVNNTLFPTLKELPVTPDTPVKKAIVKSTFEDANNYMKDGVYLRQVIDVIDEIEFDDVKESHAFGFVYEEILKDLQAAGSSGEFYTPRAVTDFMALMVKPKLGERMADFACGTGGFITSWLGQLAQQVTDTEAQKAFDDSIYGVEKKPFPYLLCVTNMLLHDIEVPKIFHENSLKHNLLDYTEDDKFNVILMNPPYGGHEDKSIQGFFPDDLASSETADLFMSVIMYRLKKDGRAAVVVPDGFLFGLDTAKVSIKKALLTKFNLHTIIRLPGSVFSPYTSITTNLLFFDNTAPKNETWFYRVDIPSDRKHFSKTKPMELKHFDDCIAWWNDRKEIILEDGPKAQVFSTSYLLDEQGCNWDLCGFPHEDEEVLNPEDTIGAAQEIIKSLTIEINNASDSVLSMLNNITPEHASVKLGQACKRLSSEITELPDKIRKSILQYAVQGKLVEQIATDSDVSIALSQIAKEKEMLIKKGLAKKSKTLTPIADEDKLFEIPDTWRWIKLGEISSLITKGTTPRGGNVAYLDEGIGFLRAENVAGLDKLDKDNLKCIDEETHNGYLKRSIIQANDILITIAGTLGRTGLVREEDLPLNANQAVSMVRLVNTELIDLKYIIYVLNSPELQKYLTQQKKTTAIPNLTLEIIENCVCPLPPIEEQKRIVSKIEDLLPYCE